MRYIVIGNVIVYLLTLFSTTGMNAVRFLGFNWAGVLHGELWRLVTFVFVSGYSSRGDVLWLALFLYLYYFIGSTLEREWGSAKFTLYYLSGMALTVLSAIIVSAVSGGAGDNYYVYGASYINLSMFFAFAMLFPDTQLLLFFLFPVKMKWLAWFDAAFFAWSILRSLLALDFLGALLPLMAILNFFVFLWPDISDWLWRQRRSARRRTSHQTIQFKTAARHQEQKAQEQGYHHKCCVCGRTDTDYPDLEFRYCSRCAGYHCFCQDHIFNHVHFTE